MSASSARLINVLSTPNNTSASGLSFTRMARVSAWPASGCLMSFSVALLADSNSLITASLSANDSWVSRVSARGPASVGGAVGFVGVAVGCAGVAAGWVGAVAGWGGGVVGWAGA